jgi:ABC-type antimicrobial peptide transport system permease subunit
VALVVRPDGDPGGAETAIRSAIRRIDPSLAVYRTRPLTAIVERAAARRTFLFAATASASAVALLLGAAGLYAVMTVVVTLRRREMGIRLALGADPAGIRRMVTREAMTVAVCGILAGLAAAMALTRFLGALLYEVSPTDPSILAGAAVLLASIAAAASWLPARRAAAVDPAITLRAE